MSRRVGQAGFTLLELLIAMTLMGMILVLLFGGLRLGVRSWDASQRQVDTLNSVRSVENFLRREISLTYPYVWKNTPGQRVAFLGERNKLSFVAQLPTRVGGGGAVRHFGRAGTTGKSSAHCLAAFARKHSDAGLHCAG